MSIHIQAASGEIADRVLLPGDPLRAKYIAETFLQDAVCYNRVRNAFGYTGTYKGKRVSIQGTGMAEKSIQDGSAFEKFAAMVEAQGGDSSVLRDTDKFAKAPFSQEVLAPADGYIVKMNAEECGIASVVLGAGRETKDSAIDFSAGIMHSHTYSGNPLGCAAALAVQQIFAAEPVLERSGENAAWLTGAMEQKLLMAQLAVQLQETEKEQQQGGAQGVQGRGMPVIAGSDGEDRCKKE